MFVDCINNRMQFMHEKTFTDIDSVLFLEIDKRGRCGISESLRLNHKEKI